MTELLRRVRFGAFEFDAAASELTRDGARVRLQDLPLRLLAILLEQPGRLVSRDELQQRLWPNTSFLDFEDGLNTAIHKLRQALKDDRARPSYLETVRNRGYRIIAPVTICTVAAAAAGTAPGSDGQRLPPPIEEQAPQFSLSPREIAAGPRILEAWPATDQAMPLPAATALPPPPAAGPSDSTPAAAPPAMALNASLARRGRLLAGPLKSKAANRRGLLWTLTAGLLLAFAAAFAVWWLNPLPPPRLGPIAPITGSGRVDTHWKLVSDGARIYFMERSGDRWRLMQTSLKGGGAMPIVAPFPNTAILDFGFSRGRFLVGSFLGPDSAMPLWSLAAQGGPPFRLGGLVADDAAYSHNGRWIAYAKGRGLWRARADGSRPSRLARLNGVAGALAWSPHDRRLRFTVRRPRHATEALWEVGADGTHLHPLLPGWNPAGMDCCGSWTPGDRYFVYVSNYGGTLNLWALRDRFGGWRRAPRGPFRLTQTPVTAMGALVAPNARRVFYYGGRHVEELVEWHPRLGQYTPILPALGPVEPAFSRQGAHIAYLDHAGRLCGAGLGGVGRHLLVDAPTQHLRLEFPRLSPDGRAVAVTGEYAGHRRHVYLLSSSGHSLRPLAPGWGSTGSADWSPRGQRLIFAFSGNTRARGGLAIYNRRDRRVTPLPEAQRLNCPRWSPGGGQIAARSNDRRQLELFRFATGHWRVVAHGLDLGTPVWSLHGHYLYYQDRLAPGEPLYRLSAAKSAASREIASFSPLLQSGIVQCVLVGVAPNDRPLLSLTYSNANIYAADLKLP